MNNYEKLSHLLLTMTYSEMMEVARDLCNLMSDRMDGQPEVVKDPDEWASLLNGWAEGYSPEVEG